MKKVCFVVSFVCSLLGVAPIAKAQGAPPLPVSYNFRVRFQGAQQVISGPTSVPITSMQCGQAKFVVPTGTVVNPSKWEVDDPNDATKVCIYTEGTNQQGSLNAVPLSTMTMVATVTGVSSTGIESSESVVSNPFTKPGVAPAVPSGMRLARLQMFLRGATALGFRRFRPAKDPPGVLRLVGDNRHL